MPYLKYYAKEKELFKGSSYQEELTPEEIVFFYNKLNKKLRLGLKHTLIPTLNRYNPIINLDKCSTIGGLAYEVAQVKRLNIGHRKKTDWTIPNKFDKIRFAKRITKILAYMNAHKVEWRQEMQNEKQNAVMKQEQREKKQMEAQKLKESTSYKLEQLKIREKKLVSKEKRISNALKKVRKKILRIERKKEVD
jgi:hypothetical protein